MDLVNAIDVSSSGMKAQTARIKVISENLANSESGAPVKGGDPYRRKTIGFKTVLDRVNGTQKVAVSGVSVDRSPFRIKFDPANPVADEKGYVELPNVNAVIEMSDMREAQRSYEANLTVIESSRGMIRSTLELLK